MRSMHTILRKGQAYRLYGAFTEDANEVHPVILFHLTRLNHTRRGLLSTRLFRVAASGWRAVPDNEVPEVIRARAMQVRRVLDEHPYLGYEIVNGKLS